jgi:hypothetical protein
VPGRAKEIGSQNTTESVQPSLSTEERLAIILLELCFNQPLEDSESYKHHLKDFGEGPALDPIAAAMWLLQVRKHTARDYADAINWCFQNVSNKTSMARKTWIQAFYNNVVLPLQQCYDALERKYSIPTDDSGTQFYGNVSKGGVNFMGPTFFTGSQSIGNRVFV